MHNHPGGLPFPPADVRNASDLELAEARVAARYYRHMMSAPDDGPSAGMISITFDREWERADQDVVKILLPASAHQVLVRPIAHGAVPAYFVAHHNTTEGVSDGNS